MALGYGGGKLFILAFDHRGSFQKKMFGIQGDPDAEQTRTISDAMHERLTSASGQLRGLLPDPGRYFYRAQGGSVDRSGHNRDGLHANRPFYLCGDLLRGPVAPSAPCFHPFQSRAFWLRTVA